MRRSVPGNLLTLLALLGLAVFCFSSIFTAQQTYSADFYRAFSPLTWVSLSTTIVVSVMLILRGDRDGWRSDWRMGLFILFVAYGVFWELPHLLGLRFWAPPRGDLLAHYGNAGFVLQTGHYPETIYPVIHGLLAMLAMLTGTSVETVGSVMSYAGTVTFVLGTTSLGNRLFDARKARSATAAVAVILMYGKHHQHIFPWFLSFVLLPLVLLLLWNCRTPSNTRANQIALVVMGTGVTIIHPMTAVIMLGACMLVLGAEALALRRSPLKTTRSAAGVVWLAIVPLLYYLWYFGRGAFDRFLITIIAGIVTAESTGVTRVARAGSSGYTIGQLVWRYGVLRFGPLLLLCGIAGCLTLVILYRVWRGDGSVGETIVGTLFVGGGILALIILTGQFIAKGAGRSNQLTIFAALLVLGWAISRYYYAPRETSRATNVAMGGIIIAVLVLAAYTPMTVYPEDAHINQQEFVGTDWFLEQRELDRPVKSHKMMHKIAVYLNDADPRAGVSYRNWAFRVNRGNTPAHYGYRANRSVAATFSGEPYLITKTRDFKGWKLEPPNRYPYITFQTRQDLEKLKRDTAAMKIYSNGGYTVWTVSSD